MIIVHGIIECRPSEVERAIALGIEHVNRSRKEPGCLLHSLQVDVEFSNRLVFYEQWQDMESLKLHFTVPESKQFILELGKLAITKPAMKIYAVQSAT